MQSDSFLKIYFELAAIFLLLVGFQNIYGQRETKPIPNIEAVVKERCNFSAEVVLSSYPSIRVGDVFLLIDERDFTKPKLIKFFACVSKAYRKISWLNITAVSDRKELDTRIDTFLNPPPDVNPPLPADETPSPPPNYHRAYYHRFRKEYFEYSPDPTKWRMVTYNFRKPSVPLVK